MSKWKLSLLFLGVLCLTSARAQDFQNLDFEWSLIDQSLHAGDVSVSDALPGWSVFISSNQLNQVGYNYGCIGGSCVAIVGTNSPYSPSSIEGNFSVFLQGGLVGGATLYPGAASILQTGLVPASS